MRPNDQARKLLLYLGVFLITYLVPVEDQRVRGAILEAFSMVHEYAQQHVLLCLVPALFIAGAIAVFLSQTSVIRYLGAQANKLVAYMVASVSGAILAVCSCTVLPLFAGIYTRGAGLGPAVAFLCSGPAINVLAIALTARVLGTGLGTARALGAVGIALVAGRLMEALFHREDQARTDALGLTDGLEVAGERPLWQTALYFATMVGILVFANWSKPRGDSSLWVAVYHARWVVTGALVVALALMLWRWFRRDELRTWAQQTWGFAAQVLPLLFVGVLIAGFLLGRPGHEGVIPSEWITGLLGGNSLEANLFASVAGAFMYFATLTEVPVVQGLIGAGMGEGPALALLLAGPSMSLPSMLVTSSILGPKKTAVYVMIVVVLSTLAGFVYGTLAG